MPTDAHTPALPPHSTVTRTYRAAIKVGENFITIEETITLPSGATDEQIEQAVTTGMRVFQAQERAMQSQAGDIVLAAGPGTPPRATPSQIGYLAQLIGRVYHTSLDRFLQVAFQLDVTSLTKAHASSMIEQFRNGDHPRVDIVAALGADEPLPDETAIEVPEGDDGVEVPIPLTPAVPASTRQRAALRSLCTRKGSSLEVVIRERFGTTATVDTLSSAQAAQLLTTLQEVPA